MESIERVLQRKYDADQRRDNFEPPTIHTVDDIKRALSVLDPSKDREPERAHLETSLIGTDGRSNAKTFSVSATTSSKSNRRMIMDGMASIKHRVETAAKVESMRESRIMEINGRKVVPPQVINVSSRHAIDDVIERILGGYREGEYICWDLADGYTYRYEIFQHRLTRVKNAKSNYTTAAP